LKEKNRRHPPAPNSGHRPWRAPKRFAAEGAGPGRHHRSPSRREVGCGGVEFIGGDVPRRPQRRTSQSPSPISIGCSKTVAGSAKGPHRHPVRQCRIGPRWSHLARFSEESFDKVLRRQRQGQRLFTVQKALPLHEGPAARSSSPGSDDGRQRKRPHSASTAPPRRPSRNFLPRSWAVDLKGTGIRVKRADPRAQRKTAPGTDECPRPGAGCRIGLIGGHTAGPDGRTPEENRRRGPSSWRKRRQQLHDPVARSTWTAEQAQI